MSVFDRDLNPLLHRISRLPSDSSKNEKALEILQDIYKRHRIKPSLGPEGPDNLAHEIRLDGGNSIPNAKRKHGPPYREIIQDVAKRLRVEVPDPNDPTNKIEKRILMDIAEKYLDNLGKKEKENIIDELKKIDPRFKEDTIKSFFAGSGVLFASVFHRVIALIIQRALVKYAITGLGMRFASLLVPGLNVLFAVWFLRDITGPAYRKTIPTVIMIAFLRLLFPEPDDSSKN